VPVMARISDATISPAEGLVEVNGRRHPKLNSLRVFASSSGRDEPRQRITLQMADLGMVESYQGFSARGHIAASALRDHLEAKVIHDELGEISSVTWQTRDLIPAQYANPLYSLLTK